MPGEVQDKNVETTSKPPEGFAEFVQWRADGNAPKSEGTEEAALADEAPETEQPPEAAQQQEPKEDEKKPRGSRAEQRIRKLLAENHELREKLEQDRKQRGEATPTNEKPVTSASSGGPRPEDFDTYEEFINAQISHMLAEARKAAAAEEAQLRAREAQAAATVEWEKRCEEAHKRIPDFGEVLAGAADFPIPAAMAQAIMAAENGPQIAYHLAKRIDQAERIAAMNPLQAAIAIGKIGASLETQNKAPEPKTRSAAPPPAKAVRGGGGAVDPLSESFEGKFDEWERRRYRQLSQR